MSWALLSMLRNLSWFLVNSIAMRLQLPVVKLEKIVSTCKALLAKHQPRVRDVAKVTGLLVSALPAINYREMHCRSLELCKTQILSGNLDYDKTLSLSSQAHSDLQWVIENITQLGIVQVEGYFHFCSAHPRQG